MFSYGFGCVCVGFGVFGVVWIWVCIRGWGVWCVFWCLWCISVCGDFVCWMMLVAVFEGVLFVMFCLCYFGCWV